MSRTDAHEQGLNPGTASGDPSILVARGKAAARAGKKAEARHYFRSALEIAPNYPDALLWMAFLAGGGRSSLEYLVRLLEEDPSNQQARSAIRWARTHTPRRPPQKPVQAPEGPLPRRNRQWNVALAGLIMVIVGLAGGLATAAFVLAMPMVTPARVEPVPTAAISTPESIALSSPEPTATPTVAPTASATATATVVASPTALPSATPSATPTLSPTATLPPPTATATPTAALPTRTRAPDVVASPTPFPTTHIGDDFRWIDVDLTHQSLTAYEGETPVRSVIVSTGLPRTPTVTGRFKIYVKYEAADMSGPGYYLAKVPYVMYFYNSYGLHGTYWHNNFGQPMSHGCINLPTPEAEWLFNWASVGTPVVVHY